MLFSYCRDGERLKRQHHSGPTHLGKQTKQALSVFSVVVDFPFRSEISSETDNCPAKINTILVTVSRMRCIVKLLFFEHPGKSRRSRRDIGLGGAHNANQVDPRHAARKSGESAKTFFTKQHDKTQHNRLQTSGLANSLTNSLTDMFSFRVLSVLRNEWRG